MRPGFLNLTSFFVGWTFTSTSPGGSSTNKTPSGNLPFSSIFPYALRTARVRNLSLTALPLTYV